MSNKTPRERHNDRETARLKKIARAHGFKGMQGGWIYKPVTVRRTYDGGEEREVTDWKPVANGWAHFESLLGKTIGFVREPFEG